MKLDGNNFNVVGDVAGNLLTLLALLEKMPKDATLITLGDPNDRGPRSKEVIEYLMSNGHTVNSNHAHMMVCEWKQQAMPGAYPRYYYEGLWPQRNGGMNTIFSYAGDEQWTGDITKLIPEAHINWLQNCPIYIETDNFIMTHAPIHITRNLANANDIGIGMAHMLYDQMSETSFLWNRAVPTRSNPSLKGKVNLFGHNASDKPKLHNPEFPSGIRIDQEKLDRLKDAAWAIGLDTSHGTGLTGLHLPTMTLYTQEFID